MNSEGEEHFFPLPSQFLSPYCQRGYIILKKIQKTARGALHYAPMIPFFVLAVCFLVLPFFSMISRSFTDEKTGAFTFNNYVLCFTKNAYIMTITNSLRISCIATLVAMVIAFFVAMAIYSTGLRTRKWFMPVMHMSQNFAGFPLSFAFILMVGKQGFIRLALEAANLGLLKNYNLLTYNGVIPVYIWFGIPLGALLLLPGFEAVKNEWKEASTLLGCSSVGFWLKIGIPNLMPTLLGTLSIVFADSITTYTTSYIFFGGTALLLPIKIANMFSGDLKASEEVGCALSVILIMIILIMMVICNIGKRISAKRGVSA